MVLVRMKASSMYLTGMYGGGRRMMDDSVF